MRELLTPKQVAKALKVSESSVKRWCDKGVIPTHYTAGGHRRIPLSGLVEYLKSGEQQLKDPSVLGLPANTGRTSWTLDRAAGQLAEALLHGREEPCRQILLDLYLAEHSLSIIFDVVVAAAFREIGARWECGQADVYQERRGCEIALRGLFELRLMLPPVPTDAPLALGAAAEGDPYHLGTTMAELVLRDARWNATSLGDNVPFESLAAAIRQNRPRIFWLSCSHIGDQADFLRGYGALYDEFGLDVAIVVGGQALEPVLRGQMKYAAYCDNMQHLEAFAATLRAPPAGSQ